MPGKPLLTIGILSVCLCSSAHADEDVDELRAIDPHARVAVHCTRGELTLIGWDRDEVHVEGRLDDLARQLLFDVRDDLTLIKVVMPNKNINQGDGADLVIHLPKSIRLQVEAITTDVNLRGLTGEIIIRTVSGDVVAEEIGQLAHVKTMSGNIRLRGHGGRVKVVTTSGDTEIDLTAGEVSVDTVSGEVELELVEFDSVTANAISGELEIKGLLNPSGTLEASTVSGDVELYLEDPVNAVFDIRTGPGGDIGNDLSDAEPHKLISSGMTLQTNIGNGSGSIQVVTVNGDVTLENR